MNRSTTPTVSTALSAGAGALAVVVFTALPAAAHTGLPAGGAIDGAMHPVLGLDHLLALVAVGMLAATAGSRRVAWSVPFAFVAAMVAGALVGFSGVGVPAVAAAFGAAHGHAHGAELPAGALPVVYAAGFVLATVGLHLAGTAIGLGMRRAPAARLAVGAFLVTAGLGVFVAG